MLSPIECRLYRDVFCEHLKRLALMGRLYVVAAQVQQLVYLFNTVQVHYPCNRMAERMRE